MNIPNALTLVRFLLLGLYPFLYFNKGMPYNKIWAFAVFLIAGLTDALDGYIARRYNLITKWGKLMDPLADKLMLLTVLGCYFIDGIIKLWVILIIALKELLMIAGAAFLLKNRKVVVQANIYGKLATFLFYIAITTLVLDFVYAKHIMIIAVISTVLALVQYAVLNFRGENPKGKNS